MQWLTEYLTFILTVMCSLKKILQNLLCIATMFYNCAEIICQCLLCEKQ